MKGQKWGHPNNKEEKPILDAVCFDTLFFCFYFCINSHSIFIYKALWLVIIYAVNGGVSSYYLVCTETIMNAQEMRREQERK